MTQIIKSIINIQESSNNKPSAGQNPYETRIMEKYKALSALVTGQKDSTNKKPLLSPIKQDIVDIKNEKPPKS